VSDVVHRVVGEADFLSGRTIELLTQTVIAEIDVAKVERIVENLLVNAAKHTPVTSPIWVGVQPHAEGVLIFVEDEGPGVEPEHRKLIFEPFQQGGGDHPSPGSGIGLSLVARFAELHGGTAWVEDRDGGGASFRVLLPYARERAAPARAS
jgi:signal transduction histidine kinase